MKKPLLYMGVLGVALALLGCEAVNPKPLVRENMVPQNPELVFTSSGKSISLGAFEGWREKGDTPYKVTAQDLKQAVEEGLKHSNLFSAVYRTDQYNSDYVLSAKVVGQPMKGAMKVNAALIVDYRIQHSGAGEAVFDKRISSSCTVTAGQELVGMTRVRTAIEGAARENVKQLLESISKVQF